MHELSIAQSIIDMAGEESGRRGNARVVAVHLKIGALSGVAPVALRSAFELARAETPLDRAELVIEEIPLTVFCPQCETEQKVSFPELSCPLCGTATDQIVRGRELEVVALEIETP